MYPHANIWLIGHSLGGALASLIGVTFGTPVVAFEAPGEKMAASRLHLPSPVSLTVFYDNSVFNRLLCAWQPSTQHITHVYHSADPIAMGTCNGVLSSCALGGYAMESACVPLLHAPLFDIKLTRMFIRCHLGKVIEYDTVSNLSWSVDIRTHTILTVIDKVLGVPWAPAVEAGREVPEAKVQDDCVVSVPTLRRRWCCFWCCADAVGG